MIFRKALCSSSSETLASRNFYELLEVDYNATTSDIKGAYFRLSKLYHPDRNSDPNAIEYFSAITTAYDVLKDPNKRIIYDAKTLQFGSDGKAIGEAITHRPSQRSPESYGTHARHPDYLFRTRHVLKGKQSNYMAYESLRDRRYNDFVYDRSASKHRITQHKTRLVNQHQREQQTQSRRTNVVIFMFVCACYMYYRYLKYSLIKGLQMRGKKVDDVTVIDVFDYCFTNNV